jgi:sterol desaturase/sphingolipid hydroxylase (fatty acid hydroxylase superfamily)
MFYHSAIRVQLPWLDRVIVTPQVHRIHHSVDPAHHNCNFADALPIIDIIFGTYRRPERDHFPNTGLGPADQPPTSIWRAQFEPVAALVRKWFASQAKTNPSDNGST